MPSITLHSLPPSHPAAAAQAALEHLGLEFELVTLPMDGTHKQTMADIYGEERTTVPGAVIDGEPVHTSNAIYERIDQLGHEQPSLYPEPIADAVREACRWGDEVFQPLGRILAWGALHFRPEAMGRLAGGGDLDPAGTDFAIRFVRNRWKNTPITCERIAAELAALPGYLDHIDELIAEGVVGNPDHPTAADFQIGSTIAVLRSIGDVASLIEGRPAASLARVVPERLGRIPQGAFPAAWLPAID